MIRRFSLTGLVAMLVLAALLQGTADGAPGRSPSSVPFALGHALAKPAWRFHDETVDFVWCRTVRAGAWRCHVSFGGDGDEYGATGLRQERFDVRRSTVARCRVFEDLSGTCHRLRFWSVDR
jgi:hypothetical protein